MAIDETLRLKVQVVYESNNLSVKKVHERFAAYEELKEKTIESWVSKYGWIKNRFENELEAIDKLIDGSLPLEDIKNIIKTSMEKDANSETVEGEIIDEDLEYIELASKELAYKVLNAHTLQAELAENLMRGKKYAQKAKSIGTVKTYHDMMIGTYQTIYGKQINLTPVNPDNKILTEEEIAKLPEEELDKLIFNGTNK